MKKLICLILALIMTLGVLVACEDNIIDEANKALGEFGYTPEVIENITLDFYIIAGEGSKENANLTVANKIKDEFKDLYHTNVVMHFVSAEEYEKTVLDAHKPVETEDEQTQKRISIALVTNEAFYEELYNTGMLVNLYDLYSSKTYGTLKKQLANLLPLTYIEDTRIETEDVIDPATGDVIDQKQVEVKFNASYAVPNNHMFGEFEYVLVNKTIAQFCNEVAAANSCTTIDDANALQAVFEETHLKNADVQSKLAELGLKADEVVQIARGNYEDIKAAEDEWYCSIIDYPEATIQDVYSSCFVVLGEQSYAERAMQVIYKINTDPYFRNLLQYGVKDINYREILENGKVVGVTPIISDTTTYNMSLIYTGDIFKAYYSEGVCIFCTEEHKCNDGEHIYWVSENRENCENHVANVGK